MHSLRTPFLLAFLPLTLLISGCSSGGESTVITHPEHFQEDPDVAEAKAKALAEELKQPL